MRRIAPFFAVLFLQIFALNLGLAQQPSSADGQLMNLSQKFSLRVPSPWIESPVTYSNAKEFVIRGDTEVRVSGQPALQQTDTPLARALVTTEPRLSFEDAVKRIEDIAQGHGETAQFFEIDGWPAMQIEFVETLPRRGQQTAAPNELVHRTITAMAADDRVVTVDVRTASGSPESLRRTAQTMARSIIATEPPANADNVRQIIQRLQDSENLRKRIVPQQRGDLALPAPSQTLHETAEVQESVMPSGAVSVQGGVGELEIATSADARTIVIAANGGLSASSNRGATFTASNSGVFGMNDPSVARARSGNYYLAVIAFPNGAANQLGATGCTNAISRSTDNGANFALQGYSAQCPNTGAGICFPDQEHIAADATTAGNDQIYSVWRNFTPSGTVPTCRAIGSGFVTASISCSQDNGVNWTARAAIPGAGDFPRIAVGRDGAVYVVSISGNNVLLNRFSSCATGLTAAAGFPVTVATLSGAVACPMAGLDRCNDGNTLSSPTVAPDPNNAARLFVSFAERDGSGGERIVTRESTNNGLNFGAATTVSGAGSARRFMPWSCVARGRPWVGWYDRTATTSPGAGNDLTEYFVSAARGVPANLSRRADPQCASGWPTSPRSQNDSESCSVQPQLAGFCQTATGGSGTRCDFSTGGCPAGETCQTGGGIPKYGDYNGIACAANSVVVAWTSATPPGGVTAAPGLRVYSDTLFVGSEGASIWRYTNRPCTGESCPGWSRLDNNPQTVEIAATEGRLFQLHYNGRIWRHTGTPCDADICPGWQMLDNNTRTIAIAGGGGQLYQLHNDGRIWRHTGTPCTGESCPGWQMLDNNTKTVAIAADGTQLYQMHNDGRIWRHTGTPCAGESCPGWQMLDNNTKTVAIAADGSQLYQLHNDGRIWRHTGAACAGESCPGWRMLDNNTKTVAITADGGQLYQLHNDGRIWRHTSTPCTGESCPGWQMLDNNTRTVAITAGGSQLYQLHNDGRIWRHTGTPCAGESCPGWQMLDNNPRSGLIVAGEELFQLHTDPLYQRHRDGWIWRYSGTACDGDFCPGWNRLDNNGATAEIAAGGTQLFQRHGNGRIWRHTGAPCTGDSCPSWQMLDNNPKTRAIRAGASQLFQLHDDGMIWRHTGRPCSGESCPGWQRLDNNRKTVAIAAGNVQLYQLHNDGMIWRYTGTPCSGDSCPSWQRLDNNPRTVAIAAGGNQLFQLHRDGRIWRSTGVPCNGESCPGWQMLDNNPNTRVIAAAGKQLFQLHRDGRIWRSTGVGCNGESCPGWEMLDNNPRAAEIVTSGNHLYQRHNDGAIWLFVGPACAGESCPGWRRLDNNPKTVSLVAGGVN